MQKHKGNFSSSIIWTNETKYLNNLVNMNANKLFKILENETKNSIGSITNIISKQIFPLSAHLNSKFFEDRTIYIGDSAHSFHPIAGQGWNLGISDVKNLNMLVKKYKLLGIDLGGKLFCKQYHNDNYYNAYRLYQITDKLDGLFQNQNFIVNFIRHLGISFITKNSSFKNRLSDFAMGISSSL